MPAPSINRNAIPQRLLQAVPDLVLELDRDGRIHSQLPTKDFASLLPPLGNVVGQTFPRAFPTLHDSFPLEEMMQELEQSMDGDIRCQFRFRLKQDDPPLNCEARLVALTAGDLDLDDRFGLYVRNLTSAGPTDQPHASATVPQDAAYEFSAIQLMRQAAIVTNEKGRICNLNPAAEALFGYEKSELLEQGLYRLFLPDKPKEFGQKISQHINKHRCWIGKSSFFRKDGTSGRVAVELVPFTEHGAKGFLGLMRDISEEALPTAEAPQPATDKAEDAATVSLHRARNDLQVLSSLLSLQANEAGLNDSIKGALLESKDRVACVASVYRLVEGDGDVDFSKLAQEIAHQVLRTHSVNDGRVKIKAPVQPTLLSQKLSITLGLLLHELLVGIVAHTFSNSASGDINIYLKMESNQGVLTIKDNGPFHNATALAQRSGIAWKVVEALTSQLQGELKTLSDLDNELRLNFHVDDKTFGA